jgi:hypothetical protein
MTSPRPYRNHADWNRICDLLIAGRRADNGTYWDEHGDGVSRRRQPGGDQPL